MKNAKSTTNPIPKNDMARKRKSTEEIKAWRREYMREYMKTYRKTHRRKVSESVINARRKRADYYAEYQRRWRRARKERNDV